MITPLTHWLAHAWISLWTIVQHDWPYYLIALPVVGVIAWFAVPGEKVDEESEVER